MPRDAEASNLGTGTHYSLELGVGIRFLGFFEGAKKLFVDSKCSTLRGAKTNDSIFNKDPDLNTAPTRAQHRLKKFHTNKNVEKNASNKRILLLANAQGAVKQLWNLC